jgi:hypothetical protein
MWIFAPNMAKTDTVHRSRNKVTQKIFQYNTPYKISQKSTQQQPSWSMLMDGQIVMMKLIVPTNFVKAS